MRLGFVLLKKISPAVSDRGDSESFRYSYSKYAPFIGLAASSLKSLNTPR